MIEKYWFELTSRLAGVELDSFMIMPNHVHGIIWIIEGAASSAPTPGSKNSPTLGDVVRVFKSTSAIKINRIFSRTGRSIWQRNYYEHVIRDEESLDKIREYIINNPVSWSFDRENPDRTAEDPFEKWIESFRTLQGKVLTAKASQLGK